MWTRPAKVSRDRSLALARNLAPYGYNVLRAGLVLTSDTLTWEVVLYKEGGRFYQVTVDAMSGKLIARGPATGINLPALLSRDTAVAIARGRVSYPARVVAAELTYYKNTLAWRVQLGRSGIGMPNSDTFYIDAVNGKVLAHAGTETPVPAPISRTRAVALAQAQVKASTQVVAARLDSWNGQENWVVTLLENRGQIWHVFVLDARTGFIRQHLKIE